jgi:penicillin-binding protein 1C
MNKDLPLGIFIFIAKILIKIGDFILFLLKLLIRKIKEAFLFFVNFFFSLNLSLKIKFLKLRIKFSDLSYSFSEKLAIRRIKSNQRKFKTRKAYLGMKRRLRFLSLKPKIKFVKQKKVMAFLPKAKYFSYGLIFSLIFIFLPGLFFIFLQELPNPQELTNRDIAQTTKIYDRNGILLFQIYANENRTVVPLSEIPKGFINATIAIEDKDFYKNPGFDLVAIFRAAIADFQGKPLQGGSTITQQLIKSTLLSPEVSINRKIKEIILAFWAERIYSKNQILQMYFNQVPYGGTAWGVEAASETYFGKKVEDLDLAQSAFLAGMPKAPTIYSPYGNYPDLWKKRQTEVLSRMEELNYITSSEYTEKLSFLPPQNPIHAPHFVMYVRDLLIQKYGLMMVEKGGLTIRTSLDLKTQEATEKIVKDEVSKDSVFGLSNGAALVTDPENGDVLAMVGSKDYYDPNGGNVNLTTSLRQPGSSIKVVTYAAALSHGYTAATILDDSPVSFPDGTNTYSPVNYDGKFHGKVPLRIAFANSFNVPAVKTLNSIGIPTMVNLAKQMGITTWGDPSDYGLSITLGAAEVKMTDMATVYGTIANGGKKIVVNPILKITDSRGNTIEEKKQDSGEQIIDPGVAFIISNILADNNARSLEFGVNSPLNIPGISVKTGTSDNKRDNWTFGFSPSRLVAVWVGNNDNTPMSQTLASGITGAAPIWHSIMNLALASTGGQTQPIPNDIIAKSCPGYTEYFVKGTENAACAPSAKPSATLLTTH